MISQFCIGTTAVTDYLQLSPTVTYIKYTKLLNWSYISWLNVSPITIDRLSFTFCNQTFPVLLFSHCDVGATWPGPASDIRSRPNLCLTPLSTTFCHVGRILVVDQSRPVPPVPPCPVDEDGNSHSFHPRGKTEVSHLDLFYLYYRVTVCEET